jgi:DNA mismatch endonuclease (patch repair protein)
MKNINHRMSRIKSKNTKPEIIFENILKNMNLKYKKHLDLYGKPDFFLMDYNLIVFIDGCFWHKCPVHFRNTKTNIEFWNNKINVNLNRDHDVNLNLSKNYKVLRIYEHFLKNENLIIALLRLYIDAIDIPGFIVEGSDQEGKTSFCKFLSNFFYMPIIKYNYDKNIKSQYLFYTKFLNSNKKIFDRNYMSEMVYGKLFRLSSKINFLNKFFIEKKFIRNNYVSFIRF